MNKNFAAERELFEDQLKVNKSISNVVFDWDEVNDHYENPRTQALYFGWKLARQDMGAVAEDIVDARRHRYMRITTKKIRSGEESLECTPGQYDAAIDLALSRDPTLGNGITEREIEELSPSAKMVDCPNCEGSGRISPVELCQRCNESGILPDTARIDESDTNELKNAIQEMISKAMLASDVCGTKIMDEAIGRLKNAMNDTAIQKAAESVYCYPECSLTYQAMELNEQKAEIVEKIAQHFDSINSSVAAQIRQIFKK